MKGFPESRVVFCGGGGGVPIVRVCGRGVSP